MSDIESRLRAADPLHSLATMTIDVNAMKSRIMSDTQRAATASRRRQMKILSFATAAILVTTVTLVSVTSNHAVLHGPELGARSNLKAAGTSVVYGTSATGTALGETTKAVNGDTYAPVTPATPLYVAGDGLSQPETSGSVYKLNAFNDATSEAQHLATIFGVTGTMEAVPTKAFAAEYQAGEMNSPTGSMQYFIGNQDVAYSGFGLFQYIADGEENWSFDGPITSTVDPVTAARDLDAVRALWSDLNTGFTLVTPTWMVMHLSPQSNATSATETQVSFMLSIDGHQTLQGVQFAFDDTGKLVYAEGLDLSIIGSTTFPFATMAATIHRLNAQQFGDCSPTFVAAGGETLTSTPTLTPTTTAPVVTEILAGASILYQPEMMSNGEPWLVPFYEFTDGDGTQSGAPLIAAIGPTYFSVDKGAGTSCTMTLTQP
jgi:hypothetical protein